MTKSIKISVLWLLTICGFSAHSICDVLPRRVSPCRVKRIAVCWGLAASSSRVLGSRCFIEQGNVMELPYETGKFDLVTAFETVYFWPDLKQSFSEVYRVLKPGGMFMFFQKPEASN